MYNEAELNRLRHQKNVWRGIAIGLGTTLLVLLAFAVVGVVFLTKQSQIEVMRAEELGRQAMLGQKLAAEARAKREAQAKREPDAKPLTVEQVTKIAEAHVKVEGPHANNVAHLEDGTWRVTIWKGPAAAGKGRTVIVDKQGKVVRVEPGE